MPTSLPLKNTQHEIQRFSGRIFWISLGIACLIGLLLARLWYLQIWQHRLYVTLSQQNQFNLLPLEPRRGLIYDRNGVLLAENVPVFSLELTPYRITDLQRTLANLGKIISLSEDDLDKFDIALDQHRRFESVPVKTRLSEEEVARFSVNQYRFPGVFVKAALIRHYPEGNAMIPAVGYVGRINETELKKVDPINYSGTRTIGKLGVEKFFEDRLHGQVGYQQVETDATGRVVRIIKSQSALSGDTLILTLDSQLQKAALAAFDHEAGALVAIDPNNGQVLALVSAPTYDPNLFVDGISKKQLSTLQTDKNRPLYNRATRGQYAMGSTIKPLLSLIALDTGIITPSTHFFDPGWYQLENSTHIYHDWKRGGHGDVSLISALAYSCDTYFFNLAHQLGIKRMGHTLSLFGFGQKTGIEIKEELAGLIPSPEWKRKTQHASWYPGDTLISGIGQGFLLSTPLQLAQAAAALAMRGKSYHPTLLLGTRDPLGRVILSTPEPLNGIDFSKEAWNVVTDGMEAVINIGTGAQHFGADAPYSVAGKTGTAQVFSLKKNQLYNDELLPKNLRDNSLFIAFAPIHKPRIAIAVVAEHSKMAANIARRVMDAYLLKKEVHDAH